MDSIKHLGGRILITGGTGSLGTAILERATKDQWSSKFTVLARNESKMALTRARFPGVQCEIGDVRDLDWLRTIMPGHNFVIHAAALKVVPTAEVNVKETFETNVLGSQYVAMAAAQAGVRRVVGISTDKACNPTTIYGCTKALMEGLFREADRWQTKTQFLCVRYGNVLNSANSVVPFFRKLGQDKDAPLTVTHQDMTRFWLSMKQAIDIVIDGLLWSGRTGVVLVPQPPAMKIVDLAKIIVPDRPVNIIGIRAGEKIHESLIHQGEALHTQRRGFLRDGSHREYFVIFPPNEKVTANLGPSFEYTSKQPERWIDKEELIKLLEDSPG